jgi:chorismate mutase
MVFGVRGAIVVGQNTRERIWAAAVRLVGEMRDRNALAESDIVSILFSLTEDLNAGNPAEGLRRTGYAHTPLFCLPEAKVERGMPGVLRALLTAESSRITDRRSVAHVYLDGAEALRPDLAV